VTICLQYCHMNNLRGIRESKNVQQQELADFLHVSQSTVSGWERGRSPIDSSLLPKIANYFGVTVDQILGVYPPNVLPITTRKLSILGEIAAGEPITMVEDFESYVEAGADIHADFCIKIKGDSMIGARIQDGDIVFIRQQPDVANGQIAAVAIGDEATLKRVYKTNDTIILNAENPAYEPIIIHKGNPDNIRILGLAIAFQSVVK
jgi:repressor LexA